MRARTSINHRQILPLAMLIAVSSLTQPVCAQSDDDDGGFTVRDSSVGYIDNPIVGTQIRTRYETGYGLNRPNRSEFFYARGAPKGPGLPTPERNIDYQDFAAYLETRVTPNASVFVEMASRLLNPELNDNTAGLADMNAGFKYQLLEGDAWLLTGQLRTYIPTGDADRGLGTNHVSLEPGLLYFQQLDNDWSLSTELRYWIPVGGTDFAGDVIRYGAGLQRRLELDEIHTVTPIAELVGWTALAGRQSFLDPAGGLVVQDAAGDTIVNLKVGGRIGVGASSDVYMGYGRALTGDRWYQNVFRIEFRYFFF